MMRDPRRSQFAESYPRFEQSNAAATPFGNEQYDPGAKQVALFRRGCPNRASTARSSGESQTSATSGIIEMLNLKKTFSHRTLESNRFIPTNANSAFVAATEDVLEVYQRPHDPDHPLVLRRRVLQAGNAHPIRMKPGQPVRYDYEYERNGTANLFMVFAPLEGWRHAKVTDRHTAVDYAPSSHGVVGYPLPKR
jgi:hypothetical protein